MLPYGIAKLNAQQFPPATSLTLSTPVGELWPSLLAWTFMGYSQTYAVFTGVVELAGALLLLWRRTATLGAAILAAVMANVVMMNFCFDIRVKLYSSHLLIICVVVLLPDAKRLANLFILNRTVEPRVFVEPATPRQATAMRAAKAVTLLAIATWHVVLFATLEPPWPNRPESPHAGAYRVVEVRGQPAVPPAFHTLVVERLGRTTMRFGLGTDVAHGRLDDHTKAKHGFGRTSKKPPHFGVHGPTLVWCYRTTAARSSYTASPTRTCCS